MNDNFIYRLFVAASIMLGITILMGVIASIL